MNRVNAELLAENNRLSLVPKIAETYEEITAAARGEIKAIITTAEVVQISFAPPPSIKV